MQIKRTAQMETSETHKKSGKTHATKIAMTVAFGLAVSKAAVGFITGSLSILSSAVDSILDIVSLTKVYTLLKSFNRL